MRYRLTVFLLFAFSLPAQQAHSHLNDFKRKLIWRDPLIKTAVSALFNEARNSPHEWGRGVEGFAKRAGSSFGKRVVKSSVELGLSEWTHEDLHYHRLGAGSFMARVKHAVATTYWVPRDNGPGYTLAAGRIAGTFTESQVARLWMPSRVATMGAAMQGTAATVGLDVGINVLREFWPRGR